MNSKLILVGIALVASSATVGAIAAQSWKGMIVAEPGYASVPSKARPIALTDFRTCDVLVESLPDDLKDTITKQDIEGWTTNRLKNMGIGVVSSKQTVDDYLLADRSTDETKLAAEDALRSQVYVNVNSVRTSSGLTAYTLKVECHRGVFVHPGYFTPATVWFYSVISTVSSQVDAKAHIRESLQFLLDKLEKDWKVCNL